MNSVAPRIPIIPTLIVGAAIATMIALGVWQLGRAQWKEQLLVDYAAAANQPPVSFPLEKSKAVEDFYFRKSELYCYAPSGRIAVAGRNANKQTGFAHLVTCQAHEPGITMDDRDYRLSIRAVLGWSDQISEPEWKGGLLKGTIMPDTETGVRLITEPPVAGLQANEAPNLDDIPNNHRAYAGQWFFFAAVAAIIYILALRRRSTS